MSNEGWNEDGCLASPRQVLDALEERLRTRHASPRTVEAYGRWIRRFIRATGRRDPRSLGRSEVTSFLSALATKDYVSASTQNQALSALLFLYKEVLGRPLEHLDQLVCAKRPKRLPVVLSRDEVAKLLGCMSPPWLLMAQLLYGAGLRLMECVTLRIKDVDFERRQLTLRRGKGARDRVTLLPASIESALREHIHRRALEHERALSLSLSLTPTPFPKAVKNLPNPIDTQSVKK